MSRSSPSFYEKLGKRFCDFSGHVLIQQFELEEAWSTWKMHPKGDEFVYLLEGNTDMLLFVTPGEGTLNADQPPGG